MSVEMSAERTAQANMLIQFFNMQGGTSYKFSTVTNQEVVNSAIERAGGNIVKLKNFIREYVNNHKGTNLIDCFDAFIGEEEKQEEQPKQEVVKESKPEYAMEILEKVLIETIAKTQVDKIEQQIMSGVADKVKDFIKNEYGTIERKVITVVDRKKAELGEGEIEIKCSSCKELNNVKENEEYEQNV